MKIPETGEKMLSAYKLLESDIISIEAFEHIRTILKGIHPEVDKKLEVFSHAFDKLQKIQSGDVITLSAESLPEDTEEKKKRKKALLFFIQSLKNLQSEIKRVETEFTQSEKGGNSAQSQLTAWGRIIKFAKGPLGIVTLLALIIVGVLILQKRNIHSSQVANPQVILSTSPTVSGKGVQVIIYQGKQIPLLQLHIGQAHIPGCDSSHYHANNEIVTALDGTVIQDPGGCGFGKVKDLQVVEISVNK